MIFLSKSWSLQGYGKVIYKTRIWMFRYHSCTASSSSRVNSHNVRQQSWDKWKISLPKLLEMRETRVPEINTDTLYVWVKWLAEYMQIV